MKPLYLINLVELPCLSLLYHILLNVMSWFQGPCLMFSQIFESLHNGFYFLRCILNHPARIVHVDTIPLVNVFPFH